MQAQDVNTVEGENQDLYVSSGAEFCVNCPPGKDNSDGGVSRICPMHRNENGGKTKFEGVIAQFVLNTSVDVTQTNKHRHQAQ